MDLIGIKRMYRNKTIILVSIIIVFFVILTVLVISTMFKVSEDAEKQANAESAKVQNIEMKNEKAANNVENNTEKSKAKNENQNTINENEKNSMVNAINEATKRMKNRIILVAKDLELKLPQLTEEGKQNMATIYKSETKRVFLTFDDGPSKAITPQILDVLKEENVKATFFVLGARVDLNPDLTKRAYKEGHFIASHGYTHNYAQIYSSTDSVLDEYNRGINSIQNAIGQKEYNPHLFRFPGGSIGGKYSKLKKEAINKLAENGVMHVDWNVLNGDAEGKITVDELVEEFKNTLKERNSAVVLMHDAGDKQATADALPKIIEILKKKGYEFQTFYDVIK